MSGSSSNNNIIGSGSDSITLKMSEDQALGVNAEFTVNVDGQQIGGVQTVTASQAAGQTETFTFEGNWAPGSHDVTVTYTNNFIYLGLSGDRNLFVDGVTYDGQTISNTTNALYDGTLYPPNSTVGDLYGNVVYKVSDTTSIPAGASANSTVTPSPVSIGSGSDTLVLNMAEDPYEGDASFTVAVDGKQIGGLQTTTAIQTDGQYQEFDVHGNFGPGTHTVSVDFTNDFVGGYYPPGTPDLPPGQLWALDSEDRNLYVMGMSLNGGSPASGAPWELSSSGTENFTVTAGSNPSATDASLGLFATDGAAASGNNIAVTPGSLSAGSTVGMSFVSPTPTPTPTSTPTATSTGGSDTLVLNVSEDAWMGDAQYTVSVDGTQIGGTLTATASHAAGQSLAVTLNGDWGGGTHTVSVDYLNDAYGGSSSTDRNLFITGASYDGTTISKATLSLYTAGSQSFTTG